MTLNEPTSHSPAATRLRRTARVLLFDPAGALLLIRFVATRDSGEVYEFWVTPGGEIEPGEASATAASRELLEELGIRRSFAHPVHSESGGSYIHLGEHVRNNDVFFAACCARDEPVLHGVTAAEIALMRELRWWTATELRATAEHVFPRQLAELAERVWSADGAQLRRAAEDRNGARRDASML